MNKAKNQVEKHLKNHRILYKGFRNQTLNKKINLIKDNLLKQTELTLPT